MTQVPLLTFVGTYKKKTHVRVQFCILEGTLPLGAVTLSWIMLSTQIFLKLQLISG